MKTRTIQKLSIVIPLFNEESNIDILYNAICKLKELLSCNVEIICIDDGSSDSTLDKLESISNRDTLLKVVSFSRNFGHQLAVSAGLEFSKGDAVVVMDGDLQDNPKYIVQFVDLYEQGYEVVYAMRTNRKEGFILRLSYWLFYRVAKIFVNIDLPLDSGDFGLMSSRVVSIIRSIPERHRFIRGLRSWAGFSQIGVLVERAERSSGRSKYSISKLIQLALDGIFSFSVLPLRLAGMLGICTFLASTCFALYALYVKFFIGSSPTGYTSILFLITFTSGMQLCFLGILGEYLGRVYEQLKGRPLYVIEKKLNFDSK